MEKLKGPFGSNFNKQQNQGKSHIVYIFFENQFQNKVLPNINSFSSKKCSMPLKIVFHCRHLAGGLVFIGQQQKADFAVFS